MPKPISTDGTIDDLGVLITASFDLDTSWKRRGACHGWGSNRPGRATPWQVAPGKRYNGVSGSELVKYALLNCYGCPAQYDCARYAVNGLMIAGTWSLPITQLKWLQNQEDPEAMIEQAEKKGVPVQVAIGKAFFERTTLVKMDA